jgi:hypothetical protein
VHERRVGKQQADVVRVESLAALGTADRHPALADLQAQGVAEAVPARAVRAAEGARGLGRSGGGGGEDAGEGEAPASAARGVGQGCWVFLGARDPQRPRPSSRIDLNKYF